MDRKPPSLFDPLNLGQRRLGTNPGTPAKRGRGIGGFFVTNNGPMYDRNRTRNVPGSGGAGGRASSSTSNRGNQPFRSGISGRGHLVNHSTPRDVNHQDDTSVPFLPQFGFKRLFNFLSSDIESVIDRIFKDLAGWKVLLEKDTGFEYKSDLLALVLYVIGEKVCNEDVQLKSQQFAILIETINKSCFIESLVKYSSSLAAQAFTSTLILAKKVAKTKSNEIEFTPTPMRTMTAIYSLVSCVSQCMPTSAADNLSSLLTSAIATSATLKITNPEFEDLFNKLVTLMQSLQTMCKQETEKRERRRRGRYDFTEMEEAELHKAAPPDDFRVMEIIPSVEELLSNEETFLRTNKTSGAYNNAEHYLDVQFRLLREDFVSPLKKGIYDFRKHQDDYLARRKKMPIGNVRLYPKTKIVNFVIIRDQIIYEVQLDRSLSKNVKWMKSKRLLNGSLLVLTPDLFKTAYFAVVAVRNDRRLSDNGILGITWAGDSPSYTAVDDSFLMVECEVYFESYRHNLQMLQKIRDLDQFPMYKFIVEASSDVGPPKYLQDTIHQFKVPVKIEGSEEVKLIQPLNVNEWPSAQELGLDDNQRLAFMTALTKEFVIIQGPPGTGKTFLGLKIVTTLLKNRKVWRPNVLERLRDIKEKAEGCQQGDDSTEKKAIIDETGPILVVCYTNHALDQFLEGIVLFYENSNLEPPVIRIGGRCSSEKLDRFTLMEKRKVARKRNQWYSSNYVFMQRSARSKVHDLKDRRAQLMFELGELRNAQGVVEFSSLSIFDNLINEINKELLGLLSSESYQAVVWFGMDSKNFEGRVNVTERLGEIFNFRSSQGIPIPIPEPKFAGKGDSEEYEDEEEYDLNDVMRNRIVDERIDTNTNRAWKFTPKELTFSYEVSYHGLGEEIFKTEKKIHDLENPNPDGDDKKKQNKKNYKRECFMLRRHMFSCISKRNFLCRLFEAYKNDKLDLPDCDEWIKPEVNNLKQQWRQNIKLNVRWAIYFSIVAKAIQLTNTEIKETEQELLKAETHLQEIENLGDSYLLKHTSVVGMTTTGAAKYNHLLKAMKSKIVVVEEAAEVLESHIITCLTKHCEHLILVGDHQQLRPSTTVYDLAVKYHLDISLFERMINNDLNCYRLEEQHRMRPEIANLVIGTIYETLRNAPSVSKYPDVKGMTTNLFFLNHQHFENDVTDSLSKSNDYEAEMLAGLCRYLLAQGYTAQQITILTTYTGQMFLLKKRIRDFPSCQGVRVTVVDNFQGEENDIILLSLVRSNSDNRIGFLKTDNRVCVAISRAKHGLYICGNMEGLAAGSTTWTKIKDKLEKKAQIGRFLTVQCQIHDGLNQIETERDFMTKVPEGGCNIPCESILPCNHTCVKICHLDDINHEAYLCYKDCERRCSQGHQCPSKCYDHCPACVVLVNKTLPCSHELVLACSVDETEVQCKVLVEKTLPCGHLDTMACFQPPQEYKCNVSVDKTLRCNHVKNMKCHEDPEMVNCKVDTVFDLPCGHGQINECRFRNNVASLKCYEIVEVTLEMCGHTAKLECERQKKGDFNQACRQKCDTRLPCGHACTKYCHVDEDPDHEQYVCKKSCGRSCTTAGEDVDVEVEGHRCPKKHPCYTKCNPCFVKVDRKLPCGHQETLPCYENTNKYTCTQPCTRGAMECGHECKKQCGDACGPCKVLVKKLSPECQHYQNIHCSQPAVKLNCNERILSSIKSECGHTVLFPCRLEDSATADKLNPYCDTPCTKLLTCAANSQHQCKGNCVKCHQGKIHMKCQEKCERALVCGHVCKSPCSFSCPPCKQKCEMKCEHSSCKKICGLPCSNCKEKCTWACKHKKCAKLCGELCDRTPCEQPCVKKLVCGHDCVGFCGEPCPPLCRICNKEELEEIFFGNEEEPNARFVYLIDCKHCVESIGMDQYVKSAEDSEKIQVISCPKCTAVITSSVRYGNQLKTQRRFVVAVKRKIFGDEKKTTGIIKTLLRKWENNVSFRNTFPFYLQFLKEALSFNKYSNEGAFREYRLTWHRNLPSYDYFAKNAEAAATYLMSAKNDKSLTLDLWKSVKQEYVKLLDLLKAKLPLAETEMEDFSREFERIFDILQLYRRQSLVQFTAGREPSTTICKRIRNILFSSAIYDETAKAAVIQLVKELDESLKSGLGISERERLEILRAGIGREFAQNHWYKCPNGHIYAIGECGQAMEVSRCNECGAQIGGQSHRLIPSNSTTNEMI